METSRNRSVYFAISLAVILLEISYTRYLFGIAAMRSVPETRNATSPEP